MAKALSLQFIFVLGAGLICFSLDLFIRKENVITNYWKMTKLTPMRPKVRYKRPVKRNHSISALKLLEKRGYPYEYDPWKSYIKKYSLKGEPVYKGPIVKGWPPGKDRYVPHYVRLNTKK